MKLVVTTVKLPEETLKKGKELAKSRGINFRILVTQILEKELKKSVNNNN